jgi:LmbE family N-acetylglucosaminyl deacetylase
MNQPLTDLGTKFAFVFAHPDDDVLISGAMKILIDKGCEVHGIWMTSGDFFGNGEQRERELSAAMKPLSIAKENVHLMRFPDLGLTRRLSEAARAVSELLVKIKPDAVLANAFEGGHPDHDSVNFLMYESTHRAAISPQLFEFPLYNGSGPFLHWRWKINGFPNRESPTLYNRLEDRIIDCKHRMMKAYAATQWMYMIPARLVQSREVLLKQGEPYRKCPADRDHTVRPHPGRLGYERWFNAFMKTRFEDFQAAVFEARTWVL